MAHLTFNDTDEIWCPVHEDFASKTFHGDTGPSEPTCSECNQLLDNGDLELAHHVWAGGDWHCHGILATQSKAICSNCGDVVLDA